MADVIVDDGGEVREVVYPSQYPADYSNWKNAGRTKTSNGLQDFLNRAVFMPKGLLLPYPDDVKPFTSEPSNVEEKITEAGQAIVDTRNEVADKVSSVTGTVSDSLTKWVPAAIVGFIGIFIISIFRK